MRRLLLVFLASLLGPPEYTAAQETIDLPASLPAAVVDLRTDAGAGLVGATWRYSDVAVVAVDHREPGADLRPSGAPNRTNDITPHAGAADFDDSGWQVIPPAELEARRSHGRLAFNWYRTSVTLPRTVADFDVTGSTVVFELVIDD
ncbi:MAG: SMP-30/gluconolactonase/LRE family protein, partial [Gemmatimonadales bacterium]